MHRSALSRHSYALKANTRIGITQAREQEPDSAVPIIACHRFVRRSASYKSLCVGLVICQPKRPRNSWRNDSRGTQHIQYLDERSISVRACSRLARHDGKSSANRKFTPSPVSVIVHMLASKSHRSRCIFNVYVKSLSIRYHDACLRPLRLL
jgi:hypothetical protein